jgi:spore coat polysaccharide biosynthesis predicted glycosyltransferase SpsG/RimJ/RimL family protein N-acetyltransferase
VRIGLLVDAGPASGYGHLSRSFTLATELAGRRIAVTLHSPPLPDEWPARIRDSGVSHRLLPSALLDSRNSARVVVDLVDRDPADAWVVDHYGIPAVVVAELTRRGLRVLRLDDTGGGSFDGEGVLCPLPRTDVGEAPVEPRLQLYGPRYALLEASYRRARLRLRPRVDCTRILISCGGSDPVNLTQKALDAVVATRPSCAVDVVVGPGYAWRQELMRAALASDASICVHDSPRGLVELLLAADVSIGAPGHTSWERACLGVPSLLAIQAENQVRVGAYLEQCGVSRVLGRAEELHASAIATGLAEMCTDPAVLGEMSKRALAMVDGFGADRVSDALQGLAIRDANAADANVLFEWANEPSTRAQSLRTAQIRWEDHVRWLDGVLRSGERRLFVGELGGVPIGQCRLDRGEDATLVSIGLDVRRRGEGLSRPFLSAVLRDHAPDAELEAWVRDGNRPSLALFRSLGFHDDGFAQEGVVRLRCSRFRG